MPTGYTVVIDDHPEMSTRQWVMEHLARAFGICISLRDEDPNLTEVQIRERIADNSSIKYNEDGLKEAQELKTKITQYSKEDWKKLWQTNEAEKVASNERSKAKAQAMAKRHFMVRQDLATVLAAKGIGPVTKNIVKFGIEQLALVADDSKPFFMEPATLAAFKAETIRTNKRDISYHTKELKAAKKRVTDRLEAYDRLKVDLNRVLGAKTNE